MKNNILLILLCFITQVKAQQDPQYTMFWNNYSLFNPANTGLEYKQYASIVGRDQWVGFGGNPITATALYDLKLKAIHSGIGINYTHDKLGFETTDNANINYSYQIYFKNDNVLSMGIAGGFEQKNIHGNWVAIDPNDPLIPKNGTDIKPNFNTGIVYKTTHLFLGLNCTHLTESTLHYGSSKYKMVRHYYSMIVYTIPIKENIEFKPAIFLKTDFASTQIDFNLRMYYKKQFWIGTGFRLQDAICLMFGYDIKEQYRIGVSYDYTTSQISRYSSGTIEGVVALMLK